MADHQSAEHLNIGLLLYIPYRALEKREFDAAAAAGFDDFTSAQARVFQRIGPDGSRLTDLAEQAQITKQSAGFLVDQRTRRRCRARTGPTDARARLIRIADRGAKALPVAAAAVAEVEAEWTARLGMRRMGRLRQALTQLRDITDPNV